MIVKGHKGCRFTKQILYALQFHVARTKIKVVAGKVGRTRRDEGEEGRL